MNFDPHGTLAGYARTSVNFRTRMVDYHRTRLSQDQVTSFLTGYQLTETPGTRPTREFVAAMHHMTSTPWKIGEPYIVAAAMTAVIAAAAGALDLAGESLPEDIAPDDHGIIFFPEPIYHRNLHGEVSGVGAITWTHFRTTSDGTGWAIFGWLDRNDARDPGFARRRATLAQRPDLAKKFGPYVLTKYATLPIGESIGHRPDLPVIEDADRNWEPAPDGRYCIDSTTMQMHACVAITYAFWCIQAQPLASVAPAPVDHRTAVRAHRASIRHDTRVVMLRRTSPIAEPTDGDPKWHYRVRFVVRGDWRRLIDREGNPYRIWIHAHIKGPDGAPLLHGEKISVLAR